jgi:hypothetical protein
MRSAERRRSASGPDLLISTTKQLAAQGTNSLTRIANYKNYFNSGTSFAKLELASHGSASL